MESHPWDIIPTVDLPEGLDENIKQQVLSLVEFSTEQCKQIKLLEDELSQRELRKQITCLEKKIIKRKKQLEEKFVVVDELKVELKAIEEKWKEDSLVIDKVCSLRKMNKTQEETIVSLTNDLHVKQQKSLELVNHLNKLRRTTSGNPFPFSLSLPPLHEFFSCFRKICTKCISTELI
eukprot:TRINITY_DN8457_c0_g1_i9.p1 TRINITY_DN8457_c0_g1~~TRINITY_DN8457_c0_g1_i9.p1  ORF type:complete len:178 (+),score=60.75 TRINITY_DN8457_c0_g1_i9:193-726(+)